MNFQNPRLCFWLLNIRLHFSPTAVVFELLVRLRSLTASTVQAGADRLHCTDMPWILLRLAPHEQQLAGPAQPDDPVRAFAEHSEYRHLLPRLVLAMIV